MAVPKQEETNPNRGEQSANTSLSVNKLVKRLEKEFGSGQLLLCYEAPLSRRRSFPGAGRGAERLCGERVLPIHAQGLRFDNSRAGRGRKVVKLLVDFFRTRVFVENSTNTKWHQFPLSGGGIR